MIKVVLAVDKSQEIIQAITKIEIFDGKNINDIFPWALGVGGMFALGIIIYGGVMYISSAGNASRQEDAKEWIKAAVYGLILLAAGYLILNTINPAILGH